MDKIPDLPELYFKGNEDEVTPRINILRSLARIIAHDILNSSHTSDDYNNTRKDNLRDRRNHDKGLSGTGRNNTT